MEEEGANVEGAKEEGRIAEAVGSIVSTRDHFVRSWEIGRASCRERVFLSV